jgi:hypothetical protein
MYVFGSFKYKDGRTLGIIAVGRIAVGPSGAAEVDNHRTTTQAHLPHTQANTQT